MAVIAFIGLGQMGSPMASNLLKQGHQLSVFDVNPDAVQRLVDKGAQPASSPAQATIGAEFVITIVAVHKKRERDPKKMRHHVVSHLT